MKNKCVSQSAFFNLRFSIGVLSVLAGALLVLFATANPSKGGGRALGTRLNGSTTTEAPSSGQLAARTFARVGPNGLTTENFLTSGIESVARVAPERPILGPLGNILWEVDDINAIADGVAIDAHDVWGAGALQGARLRAYTVLGNGTPDCEFSPCERG